MRKNSNLFWLLLIITFIIFGILEYKKDIETPIDNDNVEEFDLNSLIDIRDNIRKSNIYVVNNLLDIDYQKVGDVSGSGVIYSKIDNNYYLITNYHVIDKKDYHSNYVNIFTYLGEELTAAVISFDESLDLAILKFTSDNNYPLVNFSNEVPVVEDFLLACGNPNRTLYIVTFGEFIGQSKLTGYEFQVLHHNALIQQGSSGGGLYNIDGELVGINTWTSVNDNAYSIPGEIVKDYLLTINYN